VKRDRFKLWDTEGEGPIETGLLSGMNPMEIIDTYLANRNSILKLLRIYYRKSPSEVSSFLGISEKDLERMEKSNELIPHQLAPKIARLFNVDLKQLLIFLGLANASLLSSGGTSEKLPLPIAAQYSGPELTEQEKIDLEELFNMILEQTKKRT